MESKLDVVSEAKQVFPDLDRVIQRFHDDRSRIGPASRLSGHYSDLAYLLDDSQTPDLDPEVSKLVDEGRSGLEKIRDSGDDPPDLSPLETIGVEALIMLEGRPALMIHDDSFEEPPEEWSELEQHRKSIEGVIPRVGRIEVEGHPRLEWVGTGFLVAPNVIMTNRHVAVEFSERRWFFRWKFIPGRNARIDFKEEEGSEEVAECDCVDVIGIHPRFDLALLRLDPQEGLDTGKPLQVKGAAPESYKDRPVYTIGYPAWDGRRNEPGPMRRIFENTYNVKRLQPGRIRDQHILGMTFHHDCSTLGGNSGSCVVDLESGQILGLHYAGKYRQHNNAIPLWKLRRSRLLRRAGVNFV